MVPPPDIAPLRIEIGGKALLSEENVRTLFCEFFNGPGQLLWQ